MKQVAADSVVPVQARVCTLAGAVCQVRVLVVLVGEGRAVEVETRPRLATVFLVVSDGAVSSVRLDGARVLVERAVDVVVRQDLPDVRPRVVRVLPKARRCGRRPSPTVAACAGTATPITASRLATSAVSNATAFLLMLVAVLSSRTSGDLPARGARNDRRGGWFAEVTAGRGTSVADGGTQGRPPEGEPRPPNRSGAPHPIGCTSACAARNFFASATTASIFFLRAVSSWAYFSTIGTSSSASMSASRWA